MTNKTLKGIIGEYVDRKDLYGLAEFTRAMVEDSISEKDELKQKILEALPKDEQPEFGCLINFASNVRSEGSETDKMIDAFNYGFRLGYKAHTEEIKQIIENI